MSKTTKLIFDWFTSTRDTSTKKNVSVTENITSDLGKESPTFSIRLIQGTQCQVTIRQGQRDFVIKNDKNTRDNQSWDKSIIVNSKL